MSTTVFEDVIFYLETSTLKYEVKNKKNKFLPSWSLFSGFSQCGPVLTFDKMNGFFSYFIHKISISWSCSISYNNKVQRNTFPQTELNSVIRPQNTVALTLHNFCSAYSDFIVLFISCFKIFSPLLILSLFWNEVITHKRNFKKDIIE